MPFPFGCPSTAGLDVLMLFSVPLWEGALRLGLLFVNASDGQHSLPYRLKVYQRALPYHQEGSLALIEAGSAIPKRILPYLPQKLSRPLHTSAKIGLLGDINKLAPAPGKTTSHLQQGFCAIPCPPTYFQPPKRSSKMCPQKLGQPLDLTLCHITLWGL